MSINIEEYLKKYSERTGLSIEDINRMYEDYLKETNDKLKALKLLRNELSEEFGSVSSKATPFYVYLVGDSGLVDRIQEMREQVADMLSRGLEEEARAKGMIDPTGNPLDWRAKNRFGKPNPKKGLPLEGSEFQREFLGIVSSDPSFETCRIANILAYGSTAENFKNVELFKFYRFRGTVGSKNRDSPVLNIYPISGARFNIFSSKLTPGELASKIDYFNLAEEDLSSMYKMIKDSRLRIVGIRGDTSNLRLEPRERRGKLYRYFRLNPESFDMYSESVMCYLPVNIPVVFKETDSIVVFGRLWKTKAGSYGMDVSGYLPLEMS